MICMLQRSSCNHTKHPQKRRRVSSGAADQRFAASLILACGFGSLSLLGFLFLLPALLFSNRRRWMPQRFLIVVHNLHGGHHDPTGNLRSRQVRLNLCCQALRLLPLELGLLTVHARFVALSSEHFQLVLGLQQIASDFRHARLQLLAILAELFAELDGLLTLLLELRIFPLLVLQGHAEVCQALLSHQLAQLPIFAQERLALLHQGLPVRVALIKAVGLHIIFQLVESMLLGPGLLPKHEHLHVGSGICQRTSLCGQRLVAESAENLAGEAPQLAHLGLLIDQS
mmetsp:Transcript_53874/g.126309  ORF Transcript_53874/g.126309 Transcript_53874/m.126309 type:complete len:285 (-) Transcript_53874:88-942(-)